MQVFLPGPAAPDEPGGTGAARPAPGLVLVQEVFGVTEYIAQRARDLARLGYVVAVPELFWRAGVVATRSDGTMQEMLADAQATAAEVGLDASISDAAATLRWLAEQPEVDGRVAIVGYCFGGGVAFAVAASTPVAALVSYYGSSIPAQVEADAGVGARVTAPSLHHWGGEDSFIPFAVQERIHAALAHDGVEWHTYPGANHAFDNPNPAFHDAAASRLAWERTTAFLARVLPLA